MRGVNVTKMKTKRPEKKGKTKDETKGRRKTVGELNEKLDDGR